ncbi:RNA-directed DNA polymerase from mobile element jockey [Trichonephila clavipes]|nr:RNA-directed DNA polymerase from mobile element jockey [Trichonephila clavipes]
MNVDSEKELSLEQKLELAMTKKISTNQSTIQRSAISKTIQREIDLFEDEGSTGKYLEKVYYAMLTVPPTSVDAERAFLTAGISKRIITSGTLQGSLLSPAIYNIYTSDCLFAKDAAILCNSITADQAVRTPQAYLSQLEIWLTKWRIAINTEKTNAIVFRKRAQNMPQKLKLFDEQINWTYETTYLSLILNDNDLSTPLQGNNK